MFNCIVQLLHGVTHLHTVFLDHNKRWITDVCGSEAVSSSWRTATSVVGEQQQEMFSKQVRQRTKRGTFVRRWRKISGSRRAKSIAETLDTSYVDTTSTVAAAVDVNGPTTIESPGHNKRNFFSPAYHNNVSKYQLTRMVWSGSRRTRYFRGGRGACCYQAQPTRRWQRALHGRRCLLFGIRPIGRGNAMPI